MQKRLAAAEIIRERNPRSSVARLAPLRLVVAKDFWVGESKPINALLHVANQETIGLRLLAAQGGDDGVLGPIYVLALIDKNESEPLLPPPGNRGIAQQTKRKLFQIRKVNAAQFAFRFAKSGGEFARQPQERADMRAD